MPGGRPKGTPKTGGRTKGTPNKNTTEIKELAQRHARDAIETLARLMLESENETVQRAAACDLLERGYGKAHQTSSVETVERFVFEAIERRIMNDNHQDHVEHTNGQGVPTVN